MSIRRLSRLRPAIKWIGVGVCALIVAGWVASLRGDIGFPLNQPHTLWIQHGELALGHLPNVYGEMRKREWPVFMSHSGWVMPEFPRPRYWYRGGNWQVSAPLWLLLVFAGGFTGFCFYRDRRRILPGHCQACAYDLTGNVSGICPECGERVPEGLAADPDTPYCQHLPPKVRTNCGHAMKILAGSDSDKWEVHDHWAEDGNHDCLRR